MPGHRCIGEEDSWAWGALGEVEEAPLHSLGIFASVDDILKHLNPFLGSSDRVKVGGICSDCLA